MAFFHTNLAKFGTTAAAMDARLCARLSIWELFALALAFSAVGIFIWVEKSLGIEPYDYDVYIRTAEGDLCQFYYADWMLPIFWLWDQLPYWVGYALWAVLNILCVFFAARIFGGNGALALVTFQSFCALFSGQIIGLLVGGLALGWWGMAHRRWHLAGLGFWLASTKFQLGLSFGLLLWLFADVTWRERLYVLTLPVILLALSMIASPNWPLNLLKRIQDFAPYDWASISFWHWLGPIAFLLWMPPLFLPIDRQKRFLGLAAKIPLTLPYFQQADLLGVFVLPIGWLPIVLGNMGLLFLTPLQ